MAKGTVYWITGFSGAGKTTVGSLLYDQLKVSKDAVVFLDGDRLREVFGDDLGYDRESRLKSAMRNANLCRLLADQGIDVVCCTISMFENVRRMNRENNERYIEIYLRVTEETLRKRNQKNLYTDAEQELSGFGVEAETPVHPDMVIDNDGAKSPQHIADEIREKAGYLIA